MRYLGPRWFFREENIAYARSEFVVVSPQERPLQIETRNEVPAARRHEHERAHRAALARGPEPGGAGRAVQRADRRVFAERADRLGRFAQTPRCARCRTRWTSSRRSIHAFVASRERIVRLRRPRATARDASTAGSSRTSKKARKPTAGASSSARTATCGAASSRSAARSTFRSTTPSCRIG